MLWIDVSLIGSEFASEGTMGLGNARGYGNILVTFGSILRATVLVSLLSSAS